MRSFAGVCFGALLLVARSVLAVRHYHRSGVMSSEVIGDVSKTLMQASAVINADLEATQLNKDMSGQLSRMMDAVVDEVCRKAPTSTECRASVTAYTRRCGSGDCLTLDNVKYEPLTLPNPYQLDAAFTLFRNSDCNPSKNPIRRFWMRIRGSHSDYQNLIVSLLKKNVVRDPEVEDIENFASQFFYMTTVYYKTYLTVDTLKAKFFNRFTFTSHLLGLGIRRALKRLAKANLPADLGIHPEERIRDIARNYGDYMSTQVPTMASFAERFANMATNTLVKTVSDYVHLPFYVKFYREIKELIGGLVFRPAVKVVKRVAAPVKEVYTTVMPEPARKLLRATIREPAHLLLKGVKGLTDIVAEPGKELLREKIPGYISKAGGLVNRIVDRVKPKLALEGNGVESAEEAVATQTTEEVDGASAESTDVSNEEVAENNAEDKAYEAAVEQAQQTEEAAAPEAAEGGDAAKADESDDSWL
uniref:RAP-1a61-3 n=2 Tax=unclassified Babesia TaxID=323723 RepID=A0A088ND43_9APIC|nr:RAP-1a61-3 [Babesia sp. BQ1/Ningxian]AIN51389.1 RAP-1a61-3 [Babesia sp. Tianzhu]